MKNLKNIINEKLVINKNLKFINHYKLEYIDNDNKCQLLTIKLPFNIYLPEEDEIISIYKIKKDKEDSEDSANYYYEFYDGDNRLLFKLSKYYGIENLFILQEKDPNIIIRPCIYYINGKYFKKFTPIELYSNDCIIKESSNERKTYSNMILLNSNKDKVLILQRANYMKQFPGKWGFPGGSVDNKDKDGKEAAIRELQEETGIELSWNEKYNCKKYDSIINKNGSISEYYITILETDVDIKISKEHTRYEWFDHTSKINHKWMPDVFQIIQKIFDK